MVNTRERRNDASGSIARKVGFNILAVLRKIGTPLLVVVFSLFVFSLEPRFLKLQNLANISHQIVPVGLIALGQTFVLISGGIDISTGSVIALSSVTTGVVFGISGGNIVLAVLAAIAIALCVGAFNSFLIAKLQLPDLIVTLSTMSIAMGFVLVVMGIVKRVFFISHPFLSLFGGKKVLGIPYSFLLLLFAFILGYIIYNYTKLGIYTKALGSNRVSASLVGIDIERYRIILYLFSSFLAGLGGIIITCRMAIVQPIIGGAMTMFLESIAAVIIGGTSLLGGVGTIQGTFVGVILMGFIGNSLNVLNINPNLQDVFRGSVLIFILFFDRIIHRFE
jgi:ribose/xylose/arabinose/galactoside ABC-type transport system permease subunit